MATYFITGCSRGIGLEMIKQLASRPDSAVQSIFATARSQQTPEQLGEIVKNDKRVHFVQLDVEDSTSIKKAVTATQKQLGDRGLDILINNAGVLHQDSGRSLGMDSLESTLRTNVIAVQRVTAAFLPLLRTGQKKQIINISSTVGSIGMVEEFARSPWTAYKVSKAALNMLTVQLSMDLKSEGFTVVAVSPGWLKTDLGSSYADLEPDVGVDATLKLIDGVTKEDNGKFKSIHVPGHPTYDGEDRLNPPW